MSMGSIGSSSLNSLLKASLRIQAIGRDPSISDAAKRKMIKDLRKETGGIVDIAKQSQTESDKAQLVGSAAETGASTAPASTPEGTSAQAAAPAAIGGGHSGADGLTKGITVNKIG